jgi:predicted hydrocarbon binding protein
MDSAGKDARSTSKAEHASRRREIDYLYTPGKKTFHILLRMKDKPGAFSGVLAQVAKKVNLQATRAYVDGDAAVFSGFAEALSSDETAESLEKAIMSATNAISCVITPDSRGVLVDPYHVGFENSFGDAVLMIPSHALCHMFDQMSKIFGSGCEVMLFYEGESVGEAEGAQVVAKLGKDLARKTPGLLKIVTAAGWGDATFLGPITPSGAVIRLEDCFECSSEEQVRQSCAFMKGAFAGAMKRILDTEVKCEETKCRFKGDPHCEFTLGFGQA